MHSTTVLFSLAADWLKVLTEVAQVGVSILGKMLSTLRKPAKFSRLTSARALSARLKLGADWPFSGKLPPIFTGPPLSVTGLAMIISFK